MIQLGGGWDEALAPLFASEKYKAIREFLKKSTPTTRCTPTCTISTTASAIRR